VVEKPLGQTMRGLEDISCRSEVLQLAEDKDLIMVLNVRMSLQTVNILTRLVTVRFLRNTELHGIGGCVN
jgi:hypothetical protein